MHLARRRKLWRAPFDFRRATRALVTVLAGATLASSCLLNPHPEPPSHDDDHDPSPPPGRGGRGGVSGFGGASGAFTGGAGGGLAGASGLGGGIGLDSGAGAGGGGGSGVSDAAGDAPGPGPGPCRSSRDCALDSACFADKGTCEPVPTADCVPPVNAGGRVPRLGTCSLASPCSDGLTCVPLNQVLGSAGVYEAGPTGVCLPACNPCAPSCALGETCFARSPGNAFCALSLVPAGAPCGFAVTPAPCAAGLTCAEVFDQAGRTCVRHCRPEASPNLSSHDAYSASPSAECASGEVCFETKSGSQAVGATDFACVPGTLVDDTVACGGSQFCKPPARCVAGTCAPPPGADSG